MADIFKDSYYTAHARNIVGTFGSIFNNIQIIRERQNFRVPIDYGSRSHWIHRLSAGIVTSPDQVQAGLTVPRISYKLVSFDRDLTRKQSRVTPIKMDTRKNLNDLPERKITLQPTPFNFNFELSVLSTTIDDVLAIVEQIAPIFDPSLTVRILQSKELDIWSDVPFDMSSNITIGDTAEDGFTDKRLITADMTFTAKSYLYKRIDTQKVILKSLVGMHEFDETLLQSYEAVPLPGTPYTPERSIVTITE